MPLIRFSSSLKRCIVDVLWFYFILERTIAWRTLVFVYFGTEVSSTRFRFKVLVYFEDVVRLATMVILWPKENDVNLFINLFLQFPDIPIIHWVAFRQLLYIIFPVYNSLWPGSLRKRWWVQFPVIILFCSCFVVAGSAFLRFVCVTAVLWVIISFVLHHWSWRGGVYCMHWNTHLFICVGPAFVACVTVAITSRRSTGCTVSVSYLVSEASQSLPFWYFYCSPPSAVSKLISAPDAYATEVLVPFSRC